MENGLNQAETEKTSPLSRPLSIASGSQKEQPLESSAGIKELKRLAELLYGNKAIELIVILDSVADVTATSGKGKQVIELDPGSYIVARFELPGIPSGMAGISNIIGRPI